jgi:ankyrin repeat protein
MSYKMNKTILIIDIDSLYCPITREIYNEPILIEDGFIYEREALLLWFKTHDTSPKTSKIVNKTYFNCFDKKQQVNEYLLQNPEKISEQYRLIENTIEYIINNKNNYEDILNNMDLTSLTLDLNKINNFNNFINIKSNVLLKKLIDITIDLEYSNNNGWRPIHFICRYSNPEMIKYIIDKGVNLECVINNGWKPIHFICRHSGPEMIKYIIDKGVDLECVTTSGWRPIHLICRHSTPEMIEYIIDKKVNLECVITDNGWRPIHFICTYSTPEMIEYIINKRVNLECVTTNDWRPIHFICTYSTPEMIEYIIDKGVNLECVTNEGYKPIHLIFKFSTSEMLKYIIDKGVDLEHTTVNGYKIIHLICREYNFKTIEHIINIYIQKDFDIKIRVNNKDNYNIIDMIKINKLMNNKEKREMKHMLNKFIKRSFNDIICDLFYY